MKHNNTNLAFPSAFRRVSKGSAVKYVNTSIEALRVSYCRSCVSAIGTHIYRLACSRESPRKLYVRPTPAVYAAARELWTKFQLNGRNVLGIAFKNPPQLKNKCRMMQSPERHYMWARAWASDANETLFEAVPGANRTEHCQPSNSSLFSAVELLRQKFKFDAIGRRRRGCDPRINSVVPRKCRSSLVVRKRFELPGPTMMCCTFPGFPNLAIGRFKANFPLSSCKKKKCFVLIVNTERL